jgi:hypothetical protein
MRWLLEPYASSRMYRVTAYLALGLPLGTFEFVVLVVGLSTGLGLIITLLGIPLLVGTLLLARGLGDFERGLAESLLDAPMPRRRASRDLASGAFWSRLRELVLSWRTWRDVAFLLARLPLGIAGFVALAALVWLALAGFVQPIVVAAGGETDFGDWTIDTFAESLVFLPVSVVLVLVGPRLLLAAGALAARIATAWLGLLETDELKRSVADVLARTGEADAFEILDELELRLGRGPFLNPTRLEAALLALESTGHVTARRGGSRTLYGLA